MTSVVSSLAPAHAIIQVVHSGTVTHSDLRESVQRVGALARQTDTWHVLTDCTDLLDFPGAIDLLSLVEAVDATGLDPRVRHGLVWPRDSHARLDFDFMRTVEQNHGIRTKTFTDRAAAVEWLDSQVSPAG